MFPFDALTLLVAVAGCICASYEDLRTGKVPNRIPWAMLLLSAPAAVIRQLSGENSFLWIYAANFLLGFFIGIALWYIRAWSGGDAKMFWAICALVPVYPHFIAGQSGFNPPYYSEYFFGMTVLFNLAILLILKTFISALTLLIREKKTKELIILAARPLIYVAVSFMFASAAANVSGIRELAYSSILIVLLLSYAERKHNRLFLPACALLLAIGFIYSGRIDACGQKTLISLTFLASAYAVASSVPVTRFIGLSEAREGMSLARAVKDSSGNAIVSPRPSGLTGSDLAALKEREKEFGGKIEVGISFPLMPFMLASLLLSLYADAFWLMFG